MAPDGGDVRAVASTKETIAATTRRNGLNILKVIWKLLDGGKIDLCEESTFHIRRDEDFKYMFPLVHRSSKLSTKLPSNLDRGWVVICEHFIVYIVEFYHTNQTHQRKNYRTCQSQIAAPPRFG